MPSNDLSQKTVSCGCCGRLFAGRDPDRRLVTAYKSYIAGRALALLGSVALLVALLVKFIMLDAKGSVNIVILVAISGSFAGIIIGALLIFWAAGRAKRVQSEYEDQRQLRPESAISNISFGSNSERNLIHQQNFMYVTPPLETIVQNQRY